MLIEQETASKFHLRIPPLHLRILEQLHLRQITPADIAPDHATQELLFQIYRDIAGDPNLGPGNDGHCQDWQGDWGWWKKLTNTITPPTTRG